MNTKMCQSALVIVFAFGLVAQVQGVLPEETKFEAIYKGEGVSCNGALASVDVNSATVVETEEGVATAVADAVATALNAVDSDPTSANVAAQSEAAAKVVVEAIATAVATVDAQINSPAPGCWAIAFGKAEAVAIAQASAKAIATAFAQAEQEGLISADALAAVEASTVETEVEVAVEAVALLLADGSGSGEKGATATAVAEAKAVAVNCAFAQALATVVDGIAEADALAAAGCLDSATAFAVADFGKTTVVTDGCDCVESNSQGAPNGCGLWGDVQNGDYICYVRDQSTCPCSQSSSSFSGIGWRYCGPTLGEMQKWLTINDGPNMIESMGSQWGYCGQLNYVDDALVQAPDATPIPVSPSPQPVPNVPVVQDCPRFRCLGDASACCSLIILVLYDELILSGNIDMEMGGDFLRQVTWIRFTQSRIVEMFFSFKK
eukprot:TRINITY_DN4185_c0_g1_i6.p1 TRINITY_DN4185_c0_g1~~TRINITY_DN4185_c0_g1_i6.p1  ORF type:complete len:436 (-),score=124.59 TRINITY_DN4185_c0_g1_i6:182-1489(-)